MGKSDSLKRFTNLESQSLHPHFNYQPIFQCGYLADWAKGHLKPWFSESPALDRRHEEGRVSGMKKLFLLAFFLFATQASGEPKQIAEIRKKAEAGEVESQSLLGSHYYLDLADGEKTQKEAVKWLRAAGEQGNAQSQYFLGRIFSTGCPEKYFLKDDEEAVKWWLKAAATGNVDAFKALGKSYFEGRGVPKDYKEAAKWYRQAAEQGDHQAQRHLGDQYRFGQGVAKDLVKAHAWYELSIHFIPKWQRQRQGGRAPVDVEREVLAQKMTLEQTKEARELAKVLLKKIEANKKK